MDSGTIRQLAGLHGSPAVSLVCPLDPRQPGNEHDRLALADLRNEAIERASSLIDRIDEALAQVDLQHPPAAVAIFVSPEYSRVVTLDAPVERSVTVGGRFAIRPLIRDAMHDMRARVVVLSETQGRCIDIMGHQARERSDSGFPVDVMPPTEADTPHRDFPLDEHEHAESIKFVLRAVDHALGELERHDARPVVLVGAERDLAYFDEISEVPRRDVVARLHGNYEHDTADEIAALARPALEAHAREERSQLCREVREAIGTRAVAGIVDTWLAARDGRGHVLLVEDGYSFRARALDGALESATDAPDAFDAVEDAMEEVVCHDGNVVVVDPGALQDLGHVAMLTRY